MIFHKCFKKEDGYYLVKRSKEEEDELGTAASPGEEFSEEMKLTLRDWRERVDKERKAGELRLYKAVLPETQIRMEPRTPISSKFCAPGISAG